MNRTIKFKLFMCFLFYFPFVSLSFAKIEIKTLQLITDTSIGIEYNDNLFLENDRYGTIDRDYCIHITPSLLVLKSFDEHELGLDLTFDYMRGLETNVSTLNATLKGNFDFKFPSGFTTKLWNTTYLIERDWEFNNDLSVTKSLTNHVGLTASYPFKNRLKLEGGYDHGWEKYEEASNSTYLSSDQLDAKLFFPITWNIMGFGKYVYYHQYSDENDLWNYTEKRSEIGAEWQGPYRFSIEGLVGYSIIDYDEPNFLQYEEILYQLTVKSKLTEMITGNAWIGYNGYGNMEYGIDLKHTYSDDMLTSVHFSRRTNRSYSSLSTDRWMETTRAFIKHQMRIFWTGRLELEAGYILQSSFVDSDSWFGRARLIYPLKEWWDIGAYYDFRQRISDDDRYDYINNRIGLFCIFHL